MNNSFDAINQRAKSLLASLDIKGFDQIKLPGGTSADGSHYCGGIGYYIEGGVVKVLVLPYNSEVHKTEEQSRKPLNEHELGTLYREFHEETGLSLTQEPKELEDAKRTKKPKLGSKSSQDHVKHFYLIEGVTCKGKLLTDDVNRFDPETGKPLLLTIEQLNEVLFIGHREAMACAINELCLVSRELCNMVMNKFTA